MPPLYKVTTKNMVHPCRLITIALTTLLMASCNGQSQPETTLSGSTKSILSKIELPKNGFNSGLLDRQGHLWLSSFGNGLFRFDGQTLSHITKKNGLCNDEVYTLFEDKKGQLWLGTSNGLCLYQDVGFRYIPIPFTDTTSVWLDQVYPVINPNAVHSIIEDQNGDYWIGTGGGGAYHYDGKSFTSVLANEGTKYEDSLYHNWIPCIAEDLAGNIWFASMSYGGLQRFDGQTYTRYSTEDGLSDVMIREIFVAKNGKIWLGFNGNRASALTVYDGTAFHIFSEKRDACHRNIQDIHEDQAGRLWLAGEGGVCILSDDKFTQLLDSSGQPFNGIKFILQDADQNIWFGGRNGLWIYDGNETLEITGE